MKRSNSNDMLEQKIKNTLYSLSEEQELKVLESNVDLSIKLDKNTTDGISERVYKKLGIPPKEGQKKHRYGRPILYAAAIIAVLALLVTAICAKDTPLRDRIIKLFSDTPAETKAPSPHYPETEHIYPYQSSPSRPVTKFPVEEYVDFSAFNYTDVDEIVVMSGRNGSRMTFTDTGELIDLIKKLTCHSPISSHGYSGWNYNITVRSKNRDLFHFTILRTYGKYYIFYGLYESIGTLNYTAMYTADEAVGNLADWLDLHFKDR